MENLNTIFNHNYRHASSSAAKAFSVIAYYLRETNFLLACPWELQADRVLWHLFCRLQATATQLSVTEQEVGLCKLALFTLLSMFIVRSTVHLTMVRAYLADVGCEFAQLWFLAFIQIKIVHPVIVPRFLRCDCEILRGGILECTSLCGSNCYRRVTFSCRCGWYCCQGHRCPYSTISIFALPEPRESTQKLPGVVPTLRVHYHEGDCNYDDVSHNHYFFFQISRNCRPMF